RALQKRTSQEEGLAPAVHVLRDREVVLLLMYCLITRDVDWSKIILDLDHHIALAGAQRLCNIRIDSQRNLLVVLVAVDSLRQPSRFLEQLVTDRLRRLNEPSTLAVRARR